MNERKKEEKKKRLRLEKKEEKVCQVWDHAVQETNGNQGNQMMLGQCHLATLEPMKYLLEEREWLMFKNSVTKWPPASKATASTMTHFNSLFRP